MSELADLPRLEAGSLTTGGIIHIHTAAPTPGPSANGWFTTGTEIGDPGPFAFTPLATPNVDRSGYDASAGIAYGGSTSFGEATITSGEMIPTDPAIAQRYASALGDRPRLDLTAASVRTGARIGGGSHELALRHSNVGDAIGLSPFGNEIAARELFTQLGMAGKVPAGNRELSYDISQSVNQARGVLDWDARTTEARLELSREASRLRVAGIRLRRLAVHSPAGLDDPAITLATAYAGLGLASTEVTVGEGEVGLAASLSRGWTLSRGSRLEGTLTFERGMRAEDDSIWAWTGRGYRLLPDAGVAFDVVGSPQSPERLGADAAWSSRLAPGITLSARALYRWERNLSLELRRLHFIPETGSFDGSAAIVHGADGELGGGSVEIGARPLKGLVVDLLYRYQDVIGGDSLYREAWATVPSHGVRAAAEYVPVRGLELRLAATYRSASRWAAYEAVAVESQGRYSATLAAALTIDVAVQKWLWDDRLRAHAGVRNLLGADLRYHPSGATFGPMALLQVEGSLP